MSNSGQELFCTVCHSCKSLHTHLCTQLDTSVHSHNDIPEKYLIKSKNKSIVCHNLFVLSLTVVFLEPFAILFILDINFKILKALTPLALLK